MAGTFHEESQLHALLRISKPLSEVVNESDVMKTSAKMNGKDFFAEFIVNRRDILMTWHL